MSETREQAEVIALYVHEGLSLRECAARLGISKQAVAARLDRAGVARVSSVDSKRARYDRWANRIEADDTVDDLLDGSHTVAELAAKLDAPREWVRRYLRERFGTLHLAAGTTGGQPRRFTDDVLLVALRRVARQCETAGLELTTGEYARRARANDPRSATFVARFGNWSKACIAAGAAPPRAGVERTYTSLWTDDEIIATVREYVTACRDVGRRPSASHYDESWRRAHDAPAVATVRARLGSWRAAIVAAQRHDIGGA